MEIWKKRHTRNEKLKFDPYAKDSYVEYFSKMKSVSDVDPKLIDGLSFWKAGKDGGAGTYSSGQGKNAPRYIQTCNIGNKAYIMNDLTFLSKVSKANVKVDYDNLLTTFLQFL